MAMKMGFAHLVAFQDTLCASRCQYFLMTNFIPRSLVHMTITAISQ
jgi:hypothetical protein